MAIVAKCLNYSKNGIYCREEHRQQAKIVVKRIKKDDEKSIKTVENEQNTNEHIEEQIPPSIAILFSGHEFLGILFRYTTYGVNI